MRGFRGLRHAKIVHGNLLQMMKFIHPSILPNDKALVTAVADTENERCSDASKKQKKSNKNWGTAYGEVARIEMPG